VVRRVAIVGPTCAGKSDLVERAAEQGLLQGFAVVSVDAFAIYRGLEITAWAPRPAGTLDYQLVGVVEPGAEISLGWFLARLRELEDAYASLLLVGGTSLWVRAAVNGVVPPPLALGLRRWLETRALDPEGVAALRRILAGLDPLAAARIDGPNARRIVRALEVALASAGRASVAGDELAPRRAGRYIQLGLRVEPEELRRRIRARIDAQLKAGWLEEVANLRAASRTARQAIGVAELEAVLCGALSVEEARDRIAQRTWRLARRQLAWLARDPRILWFDDPDAALAQLAACAEEAA